jgi:hypothetical protein
MWRRRQWQNLQPHSPTKQSPPGLDFVFYFAYAIKAPIMQLYFKLCVYLSLLIPFFKGTLPCGVHLFQYSRSVGKSKAKNKFLVFHLMSS